MHFFPRSASRAFIQSRTSTQLGRRENSERLRRWNQPKATPRAGNLFSPSSRPICAPPAFRNATSSGAATQLALEGDPAHASSQRSQQPRHNGPKKVQLLGSPEVTRTAPPLEESEALAARPRRPEVYDAALGPTAAGELRSGVTESIFGRSYRPCATACRRLRAASAVLPIAAPLTPPSALADRTRPFQLESFILRTTRTPVSASRHWDFQRSATVQFTNHPRKKKPPEGGFVVERSTASLTELWRGARRLPFHTNGTRRGARRLPFHTSGTPHGDTRQHLLPRGNLRLHSHSGDVPIRAAGNHHTARRNQRYKQE